MIRNTRDHRDPLQVVIHLTIDSKQSIASQSDILDLFNKNKELSVKEIVDTLGISKQTVHIMLNRLVSQSKVEKLGHR
jgi:DNA-binding IclR family transcriptional regulator